MYEKVYVYLCNMKLNSFRIPEVKAKIIEKLQNKVSSNVLYALKFNCLKIQNIPSLTF